MNELGFTSEPAPGTAVAARPVPPTAAMRVASPPGASAVIDRVEGRDVPASAFPAIIAELERTFGRGHSTVWDGALTWRTEGAPDTAERYLELTVTPRDGRTRLQVAEWRPRVRGTIAATGVGVLAGGSVGSMLGFLLSGGEGGFATLLAVAGMAAGGAIFQRAWRIGDRENAARHLEAAATRLLERAGTPMPDDRPSPTS